MKNKAKYKIGNCLWGYFFIMPTLAGIFVLNIWSVIQSVYLSLTESKGFLPSRFIGFVNFVRLANDSELFRAMGNTFVYAVMTVPVGIFLSLIVAVLLNAQIRVKSLFRAVYFLPVISAPVAIALVWKWLYNREYGLINNLIAIVGLSGIDWLGDRNLVMMSISIVGIWSVLGYNMVILLAGLQEIPRDLYEAADIDGAGPFAQFFKITVPMVSPALFFVVVTSTIHALQMFEYTYMMMDINNPTPAFRNTQTLVYLFYRYTFHTYNRGYGSAIVVFLLMLVLSLTLIQMRLQKKWVYYE
jgi:multiple sugar transport system permease protein